MAVTNRREIRCDVRSAQLLRELAELPLPLNLGVSRAEHQFFRDVYLDTPNGRLRQFGISCQYRIGGDDRRRLTLFQPTPDAPAEAPLLRHGADVEELDPLGAVSGESAPARRIRAIVEPESLAIAFTVQTDRLIRRSVRRWLRPAQFDFAYDDAAVEPARGHSPLSGAQSAAAARRPAKPRAHRGRASGRTRAATDPREPPGAGTTDRRRGGSRGGSPGRGKRSRGGTRRPGAGHDRVPERRGGLRLPIAAGSGDGACRHLLLECFGSSVGELRLLGDLPASQGRSGLEIWLVTQTRQAHTSGGTTNGGAVGASPVLWLSLDELIARAGTPSLSDPSTLAALLVAARSDLSALSRASKSAPVVGSVSAARNSRRVARR